MAYLSLYRKYRSQTFDELLGQEHVSKTLSNAIVEDRVSHAYLFTGPRGTGKTSTARILAKALNCEKGPTPSPCGECTSCRAILDGSSLDVIEMDAASHSKVEETREILAGVPLASVGGRKKVYVIDEVHMLSTSAFNALLKTLEEPPDHVVFVLATTEPHKVPATITSRTQRFDFRRIPAEVLEAHLGEVAKLEGADVDPAAVALIAHHAEGSARDALSMLDQLVNVGDYVSAVDAERLLIGREGDHLFELFDAVGAGDVGGVFGAVASVIAAGGDARQLATSALEHVRSLLLVRTAADSEALLDITDEERARMVGQAQAFEPESLVRMLDLIAKALVEMRNAPNHRLLLEVALIRAAAPETDPSATGLQGRIERLERRLGIDEGPVQTPAPTRPQPVPAVAPASRTPQPAPSTPTASGPPAPDADGARPAPRQTAPSAAPQTPAASEPPSRHPVPVAPLPAEVGFGHIRDAWPAVLEEVAKHSKRVRAFLDRSRPVRLEGDKVMIEVQSSFHADSMKDEGNRSLFTGALHAVLGVRPPTLFVGRGDDPAPADDSASTEVDLAEVSDHSPDDPVELLKKGLKAEVVEERESPSA